MVVLSLKVQSMRLSWPIESCRVWRLSISLLDWVFISCSAVDMRMDLLGCLQQDSLILSMGSHQFLQKFIIILMPGMDSVVSSSEHRVFGTKGSSSINFLNFYYSYFISIFGFIIPFS